MPFSATLFRGLYNDVYFQVGLLTTIGLSVKNAILIVEFAETEPRSRPQPHRRGDGGRAAAAAARS